MIARNQLVVVGILFLMVACSAPDAEPPYQSAADRENTSTLMNGRLEYQELRERMVVEQIERPADGRPPVRDRRVLEAMRRVARHLFVPEAACDFAYQDRPLPIGYGQTISQPYIVAFMTEVLHLDPRHKVLEVGTGSGYQAAVLAELVKQVFSIEIVEPLAVTAAETLAGLNYANVTVHAGDGYNGWPEHAPFDRIIVTAAPDHVPDPLIEQLETGGRLVVPVGRPGWTQRLLVVVKQPDGEITKNEVMAVGFVPLIRDQEAQPGR